MCGIAGFISRNGFRGDEGLLIRRMLSTITHRGPDGAGICVLSSASDPLIVRDPRHDDSSSFTGSERGFLGHRRLSIIDLSDDGLQPMVSETGRFAIVFNGEIYNYLELRDELAKGGWNFRTDTDTEVLLKGYEVFGDKFFKKLDGMFGFAIWDALEKRLVCARDPMSIKPFYYFEGDQRFVFGSEPRTVLAGLENAGAVDLPHLSEFLLFGVSDHDQGTFFSNVRQLRGGETISVDLSGRVIARSCFWKESFFPAAKKPDDWAGALTATLDSAVARQLRADVPIGAALSGGIDSSSVVSTAALLMSQEQKKTFRTLTLSNPGFEGDEYRDAIRLSEQIGVQSESVTITESNLVDEIESVVNSMGEPFSGLSMYAGYKVMQKAHQLGLKVMLNGQGGDELFLGYPRNAHRLVSEVFRERGLRSGFNLLKRLNHNLSEKWSASLGAQVYFVSPEISYRRNFSRQSRYIKREILDSNRRDVCNEIFGFKSADQTLRDDLTLFCLPRLLKFEDRNSMRWGIETRVPLLSVPLVETVLQFPDELKFNEGWTKYALRVSMRNRVPESTLWARRKRGFEVPAERWIRVLRPVVRKWIYEAELSKFVHVDKIIRDLESDCGHSQWFWRILSTLAWLRSNNLKL